MPIHDVTIVSQKEHTAFEVGGRTTPGIQTLFMVGRDGPFSVFLSDAEFTPELNRQRIEERADKMRAARAPFTPQS